ncbi:MAG: hypothetical protein FJ319_04125 [SAR202 cluster bacterium]|nr:hypothetical protein [SAR202 cluster bacterium]
MVVWIALVPAYAPFAHFLNDDSDTVRFAVTAFGMLFVPYVLFCFNMVTDAFFYGMGKTMYLAYQSIIVNGTVYVAAFLAYITGIWTVTFEGIMVLFALGIVFDTMLTSVFLVKVLYLDEARVRQSVGAAPI